MVQTCGNEFRNENRKSKVAWDPKMTEKNKLTYERYRNIMKAFPRSVHSGFGSADCFCPDGTETRKEQYAEIVENIIEHLKDIPLMFSEVAIRKKLVMKYGDPYHQEDMAKNMEIQVQFLTDARVIAEFLESIIILGKKYECKTYTSPFDGIVDIVNASQPGSVIY